MELRDLIKVGRHGREGDSCDGASTSGCRPFEFSISPSRPILKLHINPVQLLRLDPEREEMCHLHLSVFRNWHYGYSCRIAGLDGAVFSVFGHSVCCRRYVPDKSWWYL